MKARTYYTTRAFAKCKPRPKACICSAPSRWCPRTVSASTRHNPTSIWEGWATILSSKCLAAILEGPRFSPRLTAVWLQFPRTYTECSLGYRWRRWLVRSWRTTSRWLTANSATFILIPFDWKNNTTTGRLKPSRTACQHMWVVLNSYFLTLIVFFI